MAFAPGSYFARPIRSVVAELGQDKKPALVITFDIVSVARDGAWAEIPNPEQRDVKMFLTENAWPYTEAKLKSLGFNGDFANPQFSPEFNDGTELVCTNRPYNGKTFDDFDFPRGHSEVTPAGNDAVRQLNAKWRTQNAAAPRPAGSPAAPPARQVVHAPAAPKPAPRPAAPAASAAGDEPPF